MHAGRTVLAQLMDLVPKHEFDKCVRRYGGDKHVRRLSCYGQFLAMCFAQLTGRDSLRDIEICLRAVGPKLYHAGLRGPVPRSTLADANEKRDWRIFADFAQVLIAQAARLYAGEPMGVVLDGAAYALDSTTVDLCLGLFPWAKYKQTRGGVKMHTLLALRGNLPSLVVITPAHVHDVNVLAELAFEPGALYVMDRGYVDFAQFHRIHQAPAFFLARAKRNLKFRRRTSAPADKNAGVRFDQTGVLAEPTSRRRYPDTLRRVGYRDPETGKTLVFLTNNAFLSALDVAPALSPPLADRTLLPLDQAALADQSLLRHFAQRRENPDLDRHLRLRARRHSAQAPGPLLQPLCDPTDFERHAFRENPDFTGPFVGAARRFAGRTRQSAVFTGDLNRTALT